MALVRLISRKSNLALTQAREVEAAIKLADPCVDVEIVTVTTAAEGAPGKRIEDFDTTGVFTKALEEALLEGVGECAVHSAKDLPTALDERFEIAAFLPRADRRDALVIKADGPGSEKPVRGSSDPGGVSLLDGVPATGSVVATGSARRRSQIGRLRPDLLFRDLRGNMERRIAALEATDAVVVGACALDRLGMSGAGRPDLEVVRLDEELVVPAAGQGAVAVETLTGDGFAGLWQEINCDRTAAEVTTERAFLGGLRAGCTAPVGVVASAGRERTITVTWVVCSPDGHRSLYARAEVDGPEEAAAAGREFGTDAAELWSSHRDVLR